MAEFAIALPFMAILAFGTVDLGRVYQVRERTRNAAREGAFYARQYPGAWDKNVAGCADPQNIPWHANHEGEESLSSSAGAGFLISMTPAASGCDRTASLTTDAVISITATKQDFKLLTPLISNIVGTLNISSTVKVRAR